MRSLIFPILLFSSISLHWSLRKAFFSLLAILWNSAFKWVYPSFSPLPLMLLWKTQQWSQDWKRSVSSSIPKKGNAKKCSNYRSIALISHASNIMLKIPQVRLEQYVNHELPDVQTGFRKGRGTRNQIANMHWIIGKAREFQKNIYFCFIYYAKAFDSVDQNKLWKIIQEMGIQDHLTCLLWNL